MAQVPYSPIPDVTSTYEPTPQIHVETPPAAFGMATAQALEKLGSAGQEASGELYTRAQAMQGLKNETDARNSMIDFATKADQRFAQFKTQYNQDAGPEAYAKYQQDIMDLRDQSRQSLTNPMAQKMFDGEASSQTIKSLQWGAFHSAEQLKHYGIATQDASITAAGNTAALHPEDEQAHAKALADAETAARQKADLTGIRDPGLVQQEVTKARSTVNTQSIASLADTGQVGPAKALYDKAMKDNDLTGEDAEKLRTHLYNKENQYGSKSIVDNLFQGNTMALGNKQLPYEQTAAAVRQVESSNNYSLLQGADGHRKIGAYSILEPYFQDYLKQAGLPASTTVEEFVANPAMQDKAFKAVYDEGIAKGKTSNEIAARWQQGHYPGEGKDVVDGNGVNTAQYVGRFNAALWKGTPPSQREAVVRDQAKELDPNNPILPELAVQRLATQQGTEERLARESAQTANFTVATEIDKQIKSGQPVTLESVQSALPKGTQVDPLKLQKQIYQAQNTDNNVTPQRNDNFNRLQGTALAVDPEGFKNVDLHGVDLTGEQRSTLIKLQGEILKKGVVADPALQGAIRDPGVISVASSIGAGPADKEEWKKFTGALAEEIKFARAQNKPVTTTDVQDMANSLVQKQAGTGWFGTDYGALRQYETPLHAIPDTTRTAIQKKLTDKWQRDPSDQEVERAYAIKLYLDTQGTKHAK